MKLVLATNNEGKKKEYVMLLANIKDLEVLTLNDFPEIGEIEENGVTFKENATIKARIVANATGYLTIADDSGLEVDALGGMPGVRSARFSGYDHDDKANNSYLLNLLSDVENSCDRSATFKTVIAICTPTGDLYYADGMLNGYILKDPIGENGFGYDPLFYIEKEKMTLAQMSLEKKNIISHRAIATNKAIRIIEKLVS